MKIAPDCSPCNLANSAQWYRDQPPRRPDAGACPTSGADDASGAMEIQLVEILAIAMVVALVARQVRLPYTVGLVIVGAALSVSKINVGAVLTRDFIFDVILPLCYLKLLSRCPGRICGRIWCPSSCFPLWGRSYPLRWWRPEWCFYCIGHGRLRSSSVH